MKMKFLRNIVSLLIVAVIVSCSTSNDVSNNRGIQKRKYNSGFYFAFNKKKVNFSQDQDQEDVLITVDELRSDDASNTLPDVKIPENTVVNEQGLSIVELSNSEEHEESVQTKRGDLFTELAVKKLYKKRVFKNVNATSKIGEKDDSADEDTKILLYILCFFLPPVAVGIATDWDISKVLVNILFCLLCGIPGIIHAIIVVKNHA